MNRKQKSVYEYQSEEELIQALSNFLVENTTNAYIKEDLEKVTIITDIFEHTMEGNTCKFFENDSPKNRWRKWQWYLNPQRFVSRMETIEGQKEYDEFIYNLGDNLYNHWGGINDLGKKSRINSGVVMKIINLLCKHFVFSDFNRNKKLRNYLHIPWDYFTLHAIRTIINKRMESSNTNFGLLKSGQGMGFVEDRETYLFLHKLISNLCDQAGVHRINYEFMAWNKLHQ